MSFKKGITYLFILPIALVFVLGLWRLPQEKSTEQLLLDLVVDWNEQTLESDRYTEGYNAPVAARTYAYIGLAAYETAIPAIANDYHSLVSLFPDLVLPIWEHDKKICLPIALNACYATILEKFFYTGPSFLNKNRKNIASKWEKRFLESTDPIVCAQSKEFGEKVALAIYKWSSTDSLGHQAHLHNFDRNYSPVKKEGSWVTSDKFPMPPLLPYWGKVRTFTINPKDYLANPIPPYSMAHNSTYYTQALEVFTISSPYSFENKWIAEFWSDDLHGLTFSPAGRWISIANQVIEKEKPNIAKALETYLRLGLTMNDAFVACWYSKYHYNLERPETFIKKTFSPHWESLGHAPPFPSYPSGHAMLSSAMSIVLTELFGDNYEMTDNSHKGRIEFNGMPRHFHSFKEMAFENAYSRVSLGVHFRMDCDEGFRLGTLIGQKHNRLVCYNIQVK